MVNRALRAERPGLDMMMAFDLGGAETPIVGRTGAMRCG